jgi:hypothetical protein
VCSSDLNGFLPKNVMWGLEQKDQSYVGKIQLYNEIPSQLKETTDKLLPVFTQERSKMSFSTEIRIDKEHSYLTDFTGRMPNPPYQLHLEMIDNLGEIFYYGSQGVMKEPIYNSKYGAVAIIKSGFAEDNWLAIDIPKDKRKWAKMMCSCIIDDEVYCAPINHFDECGAVIGIGNTLMEAIDNCKDNAEDIKGDSVEIETTSLDEALKTLEDMEKDYGIKL